MYKRNKRSSQRKVRRAMNLVRPRSGSHTQGWSRRFLMAAGLPTIVILSQLARQRRFDNRGQIDAARKGESP
jgi:hypothetical protein